MDYIFDKIKEYKEELNKIDNEIDNEVKIEDIKPDEAPFYNKKIKTTDDFKKNKRNKKLSLENLIPEDFKSKYNYI